MRSKTVAILENRAGEQLADLLKRNGMIPLRAPALAELPDIDPAHIAELLNQWRVSPPDMFILQTGVGVKALFAVTDSLGISDELLRYLAASQIVVRGPKPTAALRGRGVHIDISAVEPYTTREVLDALGSTDLNNKRVVVQRYGETNWTLQRALEDRGAHLTEIATYRWSLPDDIEPLYKLLGALDQGDIDAVAFTSASQVDNLFAVARQAGRHGKLQDSLSRVVVASIGPVCTLALKKFGVRVDIEPHPPKLGPFVAALAEAFAQ